MLINRIGKTEDNEPLESSKKLSTEAGLRFVGEYLYPNGSVYKGQMKEEDRHGFGV